MLAAAALGGRGAEPSGAVPLWAVPLSSLPAGSLTPLKELVARGRAREPPPDPPRHLHTSTSLKRRAGGPPGRESPAKVFQRLQDGAPRPPPPHGPGPAADPIITPAALRGGRRGPHRLQEAAPRAGNGTGPGGVGGAGGSWPQSLSCCLAQGFGPPPLCLG